MTFTLPELPYPVDALAPHIGADTLETHYGKHHKGYVDKTNELAADTAFENMELEDIVRAASGPLFDNAAQVWNHTFYWKSMAPPGRGGGGEPRGELAGAVERFFGSFEEFKKRFGKSATGIFGSGYAWLVQNEQGGLEIVETRNADNPLTQGQKPILACDVWEHAYYLDRKNDRASYVEGFFEVVDWEFVGDNLAARSTAHVGSRGAA
jgi:superoxide dismutase, Fe-Mn family